MEKFGDELTRLKSPHNCLSSHSFEHLQNTGSSVGYLGSKPKGLGMGGREKERRKERGREGEIVLLEGRHCSMYNRAHSCEVEVVVCMDESHSIRRSSESIDLLVWVSNQHLGTFLCFDDTDNGYAGRNGIIIAESL